MRREHYPNRLREWREARGLSQAELGRRLGIHKTYVSKIEAGERGIGGNLLLVIASQLGITPNDLFVNGTADNGQGMDRLSDKGVVREGSQALASTNGSSGLPLQGAEKPLIGMDDLPIIGRRSLGSAGGLMIPAERTPAGFVARPRELLGVQDAYAIYAPDDTMAPAYRSGQILHVHPHASAQRGDGVVVIFSDNRALVRELVSDDGADEVTVAHFVKHDRPPLGGFDRVMTQLRRDDVHAIHLIIGAIRPGS